MRKLHLFSFLLAFLFPVILFAGNPNSTKIKIRIDGLRDTTCILGYRFGKETFVRDTLEIDSKGRMTFEEDSAQFGGIYLLVLPNGESFEFLLSEDQKFSMKTTAGDPVSNMKVKGDLENKLFFEYMNYIRERTIAAKPIQNQLKTSRDSLVKVELTEKLKALDQEVKDYQNRMVEEHPGLFISNLITATKERPIPEAPDNLSDSLARVWVFNNYKRTYLDGVDFCDERMLRTPIFHERVDYYLEKLTSPQADSVIKEVDYLIQKTECNRTIYQYLVSTLFNKYANSKVMGQDAVFLHMAQTYYLSGEAWWADSTMKSKIKDRYDKLKNNQLRAQAKDIYMKDMYGKPVHLYGVDADYTILVFWDATCGHCKKEVPALYEVFQKFRNSGKSVKGFAVSTEIVNESWLEFIEKHRFYDWTNAIDMERRSPFRQFYDVYSTPVIYLLDKEKRIVLKRVSADQIDEWLSREYDMPYEKPPASEESGEEMEEE